MRRTVSTLARPEDRSTGALLAATTAVALIGFVAAFTGMLPVLAALVLLGADVALLLWMSRVARSGGFGLELQGRALAIVWLILFLIGLHNFIHRASSVAVTQASLQTILEVVIFGGIGVLALVILRNHRGDVVLPTPLVALAVWVIASSTWSAYGLFAFVRGVQYVVFVVVASATISIGIASHEIFERMIWRLLRNFVFVVAGLIVLGVVFGPLFVLFDETNRGRFTWMGAHPGGSGQLMGGALIVLLAAPRDRIGLVWPVRLGLLGLVGYFLYINQTRTVLGGIAIAAVILGARWARNRRDRMTGSLYLLAGVGFGAVFGGGAVFNYLLRGGSISKLWSFNGRSELWPVGLAHLTSVWRWFGGLGYGASRTIFLDTHRWAGSAHSSALGNLVNIGLIGLGAVLAIIAVCAVRMRRDHAMRTRSYGPVMASLLVYVVTAGAASENLAEPTFGMAVLFLIAACAYVPRGEVEATLPSAQAEEEPEVDPVLAWPEASPVPAASRASRAAAST